MIMITLDTEAKIRQEKNSKKSAFLQPSAQSKLMSGHLRYPLSSTAILEGNPIMCTAKTLASLENSQKTARQTRNRT
jgi:hypothetical protein